MAEERGRGHSNVTNYDLLLAIQRLRDEIIDPLRRQVDTLASRVDQHVLLEPAVQQIQTEIADLRLKLVPVFARYEQEQQGGLQIGVGLRIAVATTVGLFVATLVAALVLHALGIH